MKASVFETTNALRDFVDVDFARRLEAAETLTPDHIKALQRFAPEASADFIAGGTAVYGGAAYPSNQIVGMGLYEVVAPADIDRVEKFYRSRRLASRIVVSPLADPSLIELLGARGYSVVEFNSVLIKWLEEIAQLEPASGVCLEKVNADNAAVWDRVIREGYAEMAALPEGLFLPFAVMADSTNFLAFVDGVPAGGSMGAILRNAQVAALYGSATIPAMRRRGMQTAMINRRLWEAREAGCEYAVVCTWPGSGSQRNMERRGFRVAYTKVVVERRWSELAGKGADDGH
jgi:GNAT superfamily N-acetyltransferase